MTPMGEFLVADWEGIDKKKKKDYFQEPEVTLREKTETACLPFTGLAFCFVLSSFIKVKQAHHALDGSSSPFKS